MQSTKIIFLGKSFFACLQTKNGDVVVASDAIVIFSESASGAMLGTFEVGEELDLPLLALGSSSDNLYLDRPHSILVMVLSHCCTIKQTNHPAIHRCLNLLSK